MIAQNLTFKRFQTQPDQTIKIPKRRPHLALKQLRLRFNVLDPLSQINVLTPLHPKQIKLNPFVRAYNKQHTNQPQLVKDKPVQNDQLKQKYKEKFIKTSKKHPLFVVNSLFQILNNEKQTNLNQKIKQNIKKQQYKCQFQQVLQGKSQKIKRKPRIVEGELSRLTQNSDFNRRQIYSQQKSRNKTMVPQLLMTFSKPKHKQNNSQLISSYEKW